MAEPLDTLLQVQLHDTTLDQLRHRKETLPERAALSMVEGRRAELRSAGMELRAQVDDLAGRQREIEVQIAAATRRRHEIEQRMLSGDVSASRDLQAMDQEVQHLAARQSTLEEQELELLEEEEPLDEALAANEAAMEGLAADADRLQVAIAQETAVIDEAILTEEALRSQHAAGLPAELAARYESLRARLGGVGAARLVGDRCDGCHLTMSSVEVERIRQLPVDEVATCDQCGRILVH